MQNIRKVLNFFDQNPTPWHTCCSVIERLQQKGAHVLDEKARWQLEKGASYVVQREGSLIAFTVPKKLPKQARILAAHTDSPSLRLKPNGMYTENGYTMLHFEAYGSPILPSWIGIDLRLAGRVVFQDKKGVIQQECVEFPEYPFMIPHLAPHIQRTEEPSDWQKLLRAPIGLEKNMDIGAFVQKKLPKGCQLIHHELFAVPCEKAALCGLEEEWIASKRLDNIASVFACMQGFLAAKAPFSEILPIVVLWNHEEIGSRTQEGALSSFFDDVLQRISAGLGLDRDAFFQLKAQSSTLSFDVTHALHPNYVEKHDVLHTPAFGKGLCVKISAKERYVSHPAVVARLKQICAQAGLHLQTYSGHNMIPTGSTAGPLHAARLGIPTADIGIALLAMHAARELIDKKDLDDSIKVASLFLQK